MKQELKDAIGAIIDHCRTREESFHVCMKCELKDFCYDNLENVPWEWDDPRIPKG